MEKIFLIQSSDISCLTDSLLEKIEDRLRKVIVESPEKKSTNYLTRKQVAEKLHITLPTLHTLTLEGILCAHRLGHRVLYKEHEIDAAMKKINVQ